MNKQICKHCLQPVEKNTSKVKIEPYTPREYRHVFGHLFGCFDSKGNPTGTFAEAGMTTTVCARCGASLVYAQIHHSQVWESVENKSMYCPAKSPNIFPTPHKPVAGENR